MVAILVVVGWVGALGLLVRREFRATTGPERLALAGSRVEPGLVSYALEQGRAQIGYATSMIDTGAAGITMTDQVVTELPIGGKLHRVTARLRADLTRALGLRAFELQVDAPTGPLTVTGRPLGDTVLVLAVSANGAPADTQRVTIQGSLLLPTAVPLVVALGEEPEIGQRYTVTTFDLFSLAPRAVRLAVQAESLFVVSDSATLDRASGRWRPASSDTVRAWHVAADSGTGFAGWVSADGRVVQLQQPGGFVLRRTAHELAFSNWTIAAGQRPRGAPVDDDILETTAIAASAPLRNARLSRLRVRLRDVDLRGFEVVGEGQQLRGDTLTVTRDPLVALPMGYGGGRGQEFRDRFARELAAEPLLQVNDPEIRSTAARIARGSANPRVVAERINRWLHDSLRKDITIGIPNALQVLAARNGDCNEHTQLYIALARAAGIPARGAAGLARVGGSFYYHAWPEVYLGRWIAVDPTFGEFPADAGHLRFVTGGLGRQAELLRLIGTLRIDVIDSQ